jgi:hypothetical protein
MSTSGGRGGDGEDDGDGAAPTPSAVGGALSRKQKKKVGRGFRV